MTDRRFPLPLAPAALAASWHEAWQALPRAAVGAGLAGDGERRHAELVAAWSEPWRHYHDRRHLGECLAHARRWRAAIARPAEFAVALWFHDAVYRPLARDNEAASAAWAVRVLAASGVDAVAVERVRSLVLATAHLGAAPAGAEASAGGLDAGWQHDRDLLLDIDLAVLGSPSDRYAAYEADVRREYRALPPFLYRRGRRRVLQHFAQAGSLYRSALGREAYDAAARRNLAAAVQALAPRGLWRRLGGGR